MNEDFSFWEEGLIKSYKCFLKNNKIIFYLIDTGNLKENIKRDNPNQMIIHDVPKYCPIDIWVWDAPITRADNTRWRAVSTPLNWIIFHNLWTYIAFSFFGVLVVSLMRYSFTGMCESKERIQRACSDPMFTLANDVIM